MQAVVVLVVPGMRILPHFSQPLWISLQGLSSTAPATAGLQELQVSQEAMPGMCSP